MLYEKINKVKSPLEKRFLEDCITAGLIVEPNFKIGSIHADFAVINKKLAIEVDSIQYHSSGKAYLEDCKRDDIYNSYGWGVIRIKSIGILKDGENIAFDIKSGRYDNVKMVLIFESFQEQSNQEMFAINF